MRTIAGQKDVARLLVDQSPPGFDQIVFHDLVADYAALVDSQVIAGTGTNGTILGILNTAEIITIPAGALTIQGVYAAMANAIQRVHGAWHLPPHAIFALVVIEIRPSRFARRPHRVFIKTDFDKVRFGACAP